ncbi:hypothetical protein [Heliophilum fasciatum]|uniref:Uncharacterized protein n=1 Tax=Heliophilum fasciatum TaxID=35700 RepID=A0A4R2RSH0_9FIRM|nr:hypothetical protein [Heliophilum fasciatum]MCW2277376.1 hypothetical protein [Heliophilum fasciatum]TCP67212.1 hypothetical protein EDD73_105107 [Heliophilum fasciatum]
MGGMVLHYSCYIGADPRFRYPKQAKQPKRAQRSNAAGEHSGNNRERNSGERTGTGGKRKAVKERTGNSKKAPLAVKKEHDAVDTMPSWELPVVIPLAPEDAFSAQPPDWDQIVQALRLDDLFVASVTEPLNPDDLDQVLAEHDLTAGAIVEQAPDWLVETERGTLLLKRACGEEAMAQAQRQVALLLEGGEEGMTRKDGSQHVQLLVSKYGEKVIPLGDYVYSLWAVRDDRDDSTLASG